MILGEEKNTCNCTDLTSFNTAITLVCEKRFVFYSKTVILPKQHGVLFSSNRNVKTFRFQRDQVVLVPVVLETRNKIKTKREKGWRGEGGGSKRVMKEVD